MSIIEYENYGETGKNLSIAALLAIATPSAAINASPTTETVKLPYAIVQTVGSSNVNIDFDILFGNLNNITEYDSLEKATYINDPETIVKNAFDQINNLNYIQVDDEIDKEIDAFFATRQSKKVKKILYKRS